MRQKLCVFGQIFSPKSRGVCTNDWVRKSAPYITTGDISTVDSVFCIMGSRWQGNNVTSQHRDLCTLHIHLMWRWTLWLHSEEVLSFYRHLVARYTGARWTLDFWSQLLRSNEIVLLMLIRYISIILIIKNKAVISFEMSKIGINLPQRHSLILCHSLSHSAITPFLNELGCIKNSFHAGQHIYQYVYCTKTSQVSISHLTDKSSFQFSYLGADWIDWKTTSSDIRRLFRSLKRLFTSKFG